MEVFQNFQTIRVRVLKSYIANKSTVYCDTGELNPQKFPVGRTMLYPYPGYCGTGVHDLQIFRVRAWMSYITHRRSG